MESTITEVSGEMTLADLARSVVAEQEPGGPRLAALVIPALDPEGPMPGLIFTVPVPEGLIVHEWVADAP